MIEIISRLPAGYQEVEYIESNGTQYIDTGIKGKTGLVALGEIMLTSSNQTSIALGCYNPQRCYMLSFNAGVPRYGYVDWYNGSTALAANVKYSFEVSFLASSQHLKLNGSTVISSANATTFTNAYNLFAFAYNDSGSAGDFAQCRIYSLSIYDNGTLVRKFTPCYRKADNVAGFYELLNGVFYPNAGTGSFAVGANAGEIVITKGGAISKKWALRRMAIASASGEISFSYTGAYSLEGNILRLLTSGTLTLSRKAVCDIFLVGGGGAGASNRSYSWTNGTCYYGGGGGGGGYTSTVLNALLTAGSHIVTVGLGGTVGSGAGGATSLDDFSAAGGLGGGRAEASTTSSIHKGGNGGSGGGAGGSYYNYTSGSDKNRAGGSGGADGKNGGGSTGSGSISGGIGQGTTTRAFGEEDGELFSTGGHGGSAHANHSYNPQTKTDGTGDGGDGARINSSKAATAGASGIILIRFAEGTKIKAA